jgi:predicted restriction endonuclease
VKERLARSIERGSVGKYVKALNGYKCQLCEALGREPLGFKKRDGQHYIEAHHVMPVSERQIGSLSASNILTACANHHRQMHYGEVNVEITERHFEITVEGVLLRISRPAIEDT